MRKSVAALLPLLLAVAGPRPAEPAAPPSALPPALATLKADLAERGAPALAEFWKDVADRHTPLREGAPGDDGTITLTFYWRQQKDEQAVVVFGPWSQGGLAGNQMVRLDGTDVWWKSYRVPSDARFLYRLAPLDFAIPCAFGRDDPKTIQLVVGALRLDPLDPQTLTIGDVDAGAAGSTYSVFEPRDVSDTAWWRAERTALPSRTFESAILGNTRRLWLYEPVSPPGTRPPAHLLIVFDGGDLVRALPMRTLLDRLVARGELPPAVVVFVDPPDGPSRQKELGANDLFARFLTEELVPALARERSMSLTPARTAVAGFSRGGLAAAHTAMQSPETFGAAIALSGAFWFDRDKAPGGGHEWLAREVVRRPTVPIRLFLRAGILEVGPSPGDGPSLLVANRHLRDVLVAKGYDVDYGEVSGGHDILSWAMSLPDALSWLWRRPLRQNGRSPMAQESEQ